jgi:hypothetical protein
MTTLAIMKDRIARELRRSNLTVAIAEAINTAIQAYEHERFYVNESRENTFDTEIDKMRYGVADASFIGLISKLDYVFLLIGDQPFELYPQRPRVLEDASTNDTIKGQPLEYAWYDEKLWLYPIPSGVWTVRVGAVLEQAAPATDAETGNFWMTKAERLIRSRAKQELGLHVMFDTELAQVAGAAATEALEQLVLATTRKTKTGGGRIVPMNM